PESNNVSFVEGEKPNQRQSGLSRKTLEEGLRDDQFGGCYANCSSVSYKADECTSKGNAVGEDRNTTQLDILEKRRDRGASK
ncbi:unnamed protein product, partial [Ceratitis capitata]